MEIEKINISCIRNGQREKAIVDLKENEETVEIKFALSEILIVEESDNYFEALLNLRRKLEKRSIQLLCKGCCRNVYPSGMLLNMGVGRKAYTLICGQQAKMDSLVDIFDACTIEEYGTIEQQADFFEKWANSLE